MGQTDTDFITTLAAITRDQYLPRVQDNLFNNFAVLNAIKQKSQVIIRDGGINLQIPILVSANTTTDSMTYYDVVDTSPQKGVIDAYTPKAYYSTAITISSQEEQENQGDSKVADLMAAKMMQAEDSQNYRINGDLYLDGTGNGGKNLVGLLAMIPSSSSAGTYLGIASVTPWTHAYTSGASANTLATLDNLYYTLADGVDKPDLIVTGPNGFTMYEKYNRSSGLGVQYVNAKMADGGFASAMYKGMPMVLDQAAPDYATSAPYYQMLTSKYLGFYFKSDMTDFVRPANQNARVALMNVTCQLVTNNRRRQGKCAVGT